MSKSENRKSGCVTSLRLTSQERIQLEVAARALGLGPSAYARRVLQSNLRGDQTGIPDSRAERARVLAHWTATMGGIANDLARLAASDTRADAVSLSELRASVRACHDAMIGAAERRR